MKKLFDIILKLSMPLAVNYLKENEDRLAKKFADSKDIPLIGEKAEKELASAVIGVVAELLEDVKIK
jgi:hypothetical protein|tara:strand:+ start:369 stop:569 length:201 start_codon:yes stop_codon:yes gene_type:complete